LEKIKKQLSSNQITLNRLKHRHNNGCNNIANENLKRSTRIVQVDYLICLIKRLMVASLSLSSFLSYSFLTLHVFSDANRFVIVRLFNEEIRMVKTFTWYVWKGENNKVINQEGTLDDKWVVLDIVNLEGCVLFSSRISACRAL
jgi:hypothetical protein